MTAAFTPRSLAVCVNRLWVFLVSPTRAFANPNHFLPRFMSWVSLEIHCLPFSFALLSPNITFSDSGATFLSHIIIPFHKHLPYPHFLTLDYGILTIPYHISRRDILPPSHLPTLFQHSWESSGEFLEPAQVLGIHVQWISLSTLFNNVTPALTILLYFFLIALIWYHSCILYLFVSYLCSKLECVFHKDKDFFFFFSTNKKVLGHSLSPGYLGETAGEAGWSGGNIWSSFLNMLSLRYMYIYTHI